MEFCTSIHCMDGRIQQPIIDHLKSRHGFTYIDTVTEPGPCKIIAEKTSRSVVRQIQKRLDISTNAHGSTTIAVSGHFDCAANAADKNEQIEQLFKCKAWVEKSYPFARIILLYVNNDLTVEELAG